MPQPSDQAPESRADRAARLARERELIREAEADLAAGRFTEGPEAEALLERLRSGLAKPPEADRTAPASDVRRNGRARESDVRDLQEPLSENP